MMNLEGPDVKRKTYTSPLREARARSTRLAIIEAAAELFISRGFGATSIDSVAEAAGVGRATVFASVGGKAQLLRAAYDVALVGDDEPVALPQRPWAQRVRESSTQREAVDRYAQGIIDYGARVARIYEAFRGAASTDPDVRDSWNEIREARRVGAGRFVKVLTKLGPLRDGLTVRAAGDLVWLLNDPSLYHQLVIEQSWEAHEFGPWLAWTMRTQLLQPARRARAR